MAQTVLELEKTSEFIKISDAAAHSIDYRLNILGIRVWKDYCQLIARTGSRWSPVGPPRHLPVQVPENPSALEAAAGDTLRLTAYQYNVERPGSDLVEILSGMKHFETALTGTAGLATRKF